MDLPNFDEATRCYAAALTTDELSESHGLLCGMLCAQPSLGIADFENSCRARELASAFTGEGYSVMEQLFNASRAQLSASDLGIALWLPDDEESLLTRTRALGNWCSGFLGGLAEICGEQLMQVSEDLREIVTDLGNIAQASSAASAVDAGDDDEIEETAYAEIVEYVRVAALLVQEELRGPGEQERIH